MERSDVLSSHASASSVSHRTVSASATDAYTPFPREAVESSIPARFERQVALYSSRVAVRTQRHTLTYHDLNQAANRVARAILGQSAAGAGRVGLLLAHDAALITGLLGTLKAGKAYLPLDATQPKQRSIGILEDSRAELILTDTEHHSLALELSRDALPVIDTDRVDPRSSASNLDLPIAPDSPAYLLYTSGSTGSPKGVIQVHRNILHNAMWFTNRLRINADDRLSLIFPSTYGAAAVVTFAALLNGAVLCPYGVRERGIGSLAPWLQDERITIHHTVPAVFREMAEMLSGNDEFPSLRLLCLDGDTISRADIELYKKYFPATCTLVPTDTGAEN